MSFKNKYRSALSRLTSIFFILLFCLYSSINGYAQTTNIQGIINSYTPVTNVSTCSVDVLNVSSFNKGDRVLIIQMKGADVDSSNTPSFGDVLNINNCGNYEFNHISLIIGNTIFFASPLQRTYTVTGKVQLIKVPQYVDATTTGTITCPAWNGNSGGIVVLECSGTLTLNDSITANSKGLKFGTFSPPGYNCTGHFDYYYSSVDYFGGEKGEGITSISLSKSNGMGKQANGGGGGNNVNAGGGGGGNFGKGGNGGNSYEGCPPLHDIGGRGGQAMTYSNVTNKIFMGGGGGGGQDNNLQATTGTTGGGIIIIRSNSIAGNGIIDVGAKKPLNGGCDGAGGAGSGGTVLLDVNSYTGALGILANGADGAITTCYAQGASGGGGGGCVWSKTSLPNIVNFNVSGGIRGIHGQGTENGMPGDTISGLSIIGTPYTPISNVTISNNDTICEGTSLSLNVSPNCSGCSYSWSPGSSLNDASVFNPIASPTQETTYTVLHTDSDGCKSVDSVKISLNPKPNANYLAANVCYNEMSVFSDSATITTGSITNWEWNFDDNTPTNNQQNPNHLYAACGTYLPTFIVTSNNGCKDTVTKNTTIHCLPIIDAGINDTICFLESTTISVSPQNLSYSYSWSFAGNPNFSNTSVATVSPANTTNYIVLVTDTNSCSATDSVVIFADTDILITLSSNNVSCYNACDGQISATPIGGNAPYVYSWSNNTNQAINSSLCPNTYSLTVTDAWGCTKIIDTSITEPNELLAFINSFTATSCSDSCNGTATITALGGTVGAGYNYSWNSTPVQNTSSASALCAGSYICTVTDNNLCEARDTVVITSPSPVTLITITNPTACDSANGDASTTAYGGTGTYTYNWLPLAQSGAFIDSLAAGSYTVNVTDANGCSHQETILITTADQPTAIATASDYTIFSGSSSTLDVSSASQYSWSPNTSLSCDTCQSPVASPKETTSYCVTITDNNGCKDTSCITIDVDYICDLTVPNAFSPNNDGKNDLLILHGWDKCVSGDFSMSIFNRWGEIVFESNSPTQAWDGKNAKAITEIDNSGSAVFIYYIKATLINGETVERKGNISLVR